MTDGVDVSGAGESTSHPIPAPPAMIATWENGVAQASATTAAATAMTRRGRSVARVLAMP